MNKEVYRILVVEDESIAALDLKTTLISNGYDVVGIVSNGNAAVQYAETLKPDLILMDIHLSGELDGIEAAELIHNNTNIPVLYLTAYADKYTIERAKVTSPYGYIIKPFDDRTLFSALEMALYKNNMEKKIRESEERYRIVTQATSDVIWDQDLINNTVWVNENFDLLFGKMPSDEKVVLKFLNRIKDDDRERVFEGFNITIKNKRRFWSDEYRLLRSDGSFANVLDRAQIIYDSSGRAVRAIGSIQDVSHFKKIEDSLREINERYETFVKQISEGIWRIEFLEPMPLDLPIEDQLKIIKENAYIAECNNILAKMYGYNDSSELIGKKPYEISITDNFLNINWTKKIISSGYKLTDVEISAIDKNGNVKFFINNYVGIIENNTLVRLWGTQRDITSRKKIESELIESENKYRNVIEQANDGIFIANSKGKFILVNPAGCNMLGYTLDEISNLGVADTFPPGQELLANQRVQEQLKGNGLKYDRLMRRKDGSLFPVEVSVKKNLDGNLQAFVRDLTERKLAEEKLKNSRQQLRDFAARLELIREDDRTQIARAVHDELGQLLTALKMDIAVLNKKLKNKSGSNGEFSEEIKSINNLIDKSIQTVRKIASELRSEILKDLGINEAIEWYIKEIEGKSVIKFNFQTKVQNDSFSEMKSSAIYRIMQEAVTNIIRHSGATKVNISLSENDEKIILEISDNGVGITTEDIENRKSFGLLGMKERARILEGTVNFYGKPGKGTTVYLTLPKD